MTAIRYVFPPWNNALMLRTGFVLLYLLPTVAPARTESLQPLIDQAIAQRQPLVRLPAGEFRLPVGLRLDKADSLTLEGQGTRLIITMPNATGLSVTRSRNVTVRGLSIDYDPLPYTQATITAVSPDRRSFDFEVHAGYPDLAEAYLVKHVHAFEARAEQWKRDLPDLYTRETIAITPRRGQIRFAPSAEYLDRLEPGDRIVLNQRTANAVKFSQCENVRLEDVVVLAGPGCGVIARYMRGDNYFRFDIRPGKPPANASQPRLMSTCADGFNYAFARRGPTLEKANFSFMGDDSVNLHGPTFLVLDRPQPNQVVIGRPWHGEPIDWLVEPGDQARGLRSGNYAVIGTAAVTRCSVEKNVTAEQRQQLARFWSRRGELKGSAYRLDLAQPLAVQAGDAIDLPAINAAGFRIADCQFHDHRARGVLLGSDHGLVERCVFERLKNIGLKIDPGYCFWREAGWAEDITIRQNRFLDVGRSPCAYQPQRAALGAISVTGEVEDPKSGQTFFAGNRRIRIEDNAIDGCSTAGIYVRCASDVVLRDNKIAHTNYGDLTKAGVKAGLKVSQPIDVEPASGVQTEGNTVRDVGTRPKLP